MEYVAGQDEVSAKPATLERKKVLAKEGLEHSTLALLARTKDKFAKDAAFEYFMLNCTLASVPELE